MKTDKIVMLKKQSGFDKTAVIRFELENLQEKIELAPSYKRSLVIFSYRHSIIGQMLIKTDNGVVKFPPIDKIVSMFYQPLWQRFTAGKITDKYNPFVSVIICTHNRTEDLKNCLESIKKLKYSNKEIIIIDNAPVNDETKDLVQSYKEFIYIREPRKGLDIARNRGIKESAGEIIAFTDDDAVVDSLWLENLVKNFRAPLVCAVTGITLPYELEDKAQVIFEKTNSFKRGFIRKEFSLSNLNPVGAGSVGAGVNMALRRKYIDETGLFDEALDGGTYSLSGGDQEFFYRVLARGYRIIYEPDALVWHKHRGDMDSLKKTLYGYGVGVFAWWTKIVFREKEIASVFFMIKWFISYYIFNLFRTLFNKDSLQYFRLSLAEFTGTLYGPLAYFKSYSFSKSSEKPVTG